MIRIEQIEANSPAARAGIEPGDELIGIDSRSIEDIVDYYLGLEAASSSINLLLERDAERFPVTLELEADEDPGLVPAHPEPQRCGNDCLFCFVHQLPRGMRRTLYVKDEDYRFSWLYGSYVTLANLQERDFTRILRDKLSPLYISVHTTDETVRRRLLGKTVPPLLPQIKRLVDAGIELHTQVVLCPGINDGVILRQTIDALAGLWPGVRSLAVVPVGLTRYRRSLPQLMPVCAHLAATTLEQIEERQRVFLEKFASRFVFAADEFYLRAERNLPPLSEYEELWQLENGVGLIAQFRHDAEEVLLESIPLDLHKVCLVTGSSFRAELEKFAARLGARTGVELAVVAVENLFFGEQVTVSGLLTGADILAAFREVDPGQGVLLPEVLFNTGDNLLLDDMPLAEFERQLRVPVLKVSSDPWGILDGLERLDCQEIEILEGV